jgi:competence protein CoiA
MLRCLTVDKETLIASNCDKEAVKELSNKKKLICPNCQSTVIFKPGKVKRPHFAHYESECVITNYEPETASHLKGKQVLYEWLKKKFPAADVEYEVYIPETNQIADIFVEQSEEGMEGLRWAFEFQHSRLTSTGWETRHELYKSADIQDFWVLDKAKYMKFSKANDITDARIRNELERTIYNRTGLCYFLDLESSELTIDFNFTTSWSTTIVRGVKHKNSYTYHSPIHHSTHIDQVRVRMNDEFKHGVLIYPEIESQMEKQLSCVLCILRKERETKAEQELQEKANEKRLFSKRKYGEEQTEDIWRFMKSNKDELTNDVRHLSTEEFFVKYEPLFNKLQLDIKEYKTLEDSEDLVNRLIVDLSYESDLFSLTFLSKQGNHSLEEYLRTIHQEKINVVTHVYNTYKKDLEKLASMNFKAIKGNLDKITPIITPWKSNPTEIDYAIRYARLETKEAADEHMKQVKEQIIYYNPFANMEDWL